MVPARRALLLWIVAAAAACGPRSGGAGAASAPPPPSIPVAPLTLHTLTAGARGLVLAVGGVGRAAPVALAGAARTVEITGASVTVQPAQPGGAGAVPPAPEGVLWGWRLAAAERAASALLALRPGDRLVSVQASAAAEPPTSATLAVAMLAALTGAALDPHAAVLAEVRADGTLAPLADPVAELDGAVRRGVTRVVLPLGGATAPGPGGVAPIDLVKRAARGHAAASLSPDLAGAYRALTGGAMPDADRAPVSDLALTDIERTALDTAYRRHLARLAEAWPRVVEQQNRAGLPAPIAALLELAARAASSAERLRMAGDIAGATESIARAAAAADAAVRIDVAVSLTQGGELDGARAALDAARAAAAAAVTTATASGAAARPGAGIGDQLRAAAIAGEVAAASAWSDEAVATASVAAAALAALEKANRSQLTSRESRRTVADAITPTLVAAARARQRAESAVDRAALESGGGASLEVDVAQVDDLVRRHRQAIAAGQALLEQAALGARPPGLVVAARGLPGAAAAADRPPVERLGVAHRALHEIAAALAPGDGLAGGVDATTGEPVRLDRAEKVNSALRIAERAARQHAAAARVAVGFIPASARVAFQAARDLAQGDRAEQMIALALYREASVACRLAIDLALTASRPAVGPSPNPSSTPTPTPTPSPTPSPTSPAPPTPSPPLPPPPPQPPPAPVPAPSS